MNTPTVIVRERVGSTSDLARDVLTSAPPPHLPLLVRASHQTHGRGRGENRWWSDAGSLTVTLAIDPRDHGLFPRHEPRLALAAAVAVVDAFEALVPAGERLGLRWPNDVEVAGRKLAGLLPERVETASGLRLLVGLGLNVRTDLDAAPADVRRLAVSLADWGDPPTLDEALALWLGRFWDLVPRLAADEPALADRWAALDTLRDRPVRVDLGLRVVEGTGRGIDSEGALLVATPVETHRIFGGRVLRDG